MEEEGIRLIRFLWIIDMFDQLIDKVDVYKHEIIMEVA